MAPRYLSVYSQCGRSVSGGINKWTAAMKTAFLQYVRNMYVSYSDCSWEGLMNMVALAEVL